MVRAIRSSLVTAVLLVFPVTAFSQANDPQSPIGEKQAIEQLKERITTALGLTKTPEPQQPEWIPLEPKLQEWTNQVLRYWEIRSEKVKSLECTFEQWEYDPQQVPQLVRKLQADGQLEKLPFTNYTTGVIKYARPDKLVFRTSGLQQLISPGDDRKYQALPKEQGPQWFIDGERVITFDAVHKEVVESPIPPELQGKPLWTGPLSFVIPDEVALFGLSTETIKERYWIRPLKADAPGEYILELQPQRRREAASFQSIQIVLDEKEFLPIRVQIFAVDYSPTNPHRTSIEFSHRVINHSIDPREFSKVQIPDGWRYVKLGGK